MYKQANFILKLEKYCRNIQYFKILNNEKYFLYVIQHTNMKIRREGKSKKNQIKNAEIFRKPDCYKLKSFRYPKNLK